MTIYQPNDDDPDTDAGAEVTEFVDDPFSTGSAEDVENVPGSQRDPAPDEENGGASSDDDRPA